MHCNGVSFMKDNMLTSPVLLNIPELLEFQFQSLTNSKVTNCFCIKFLIFQKVCLNVSEQHCSSIEMGTQIPSSVLIGLALINAKGVPIRTTDIYHFIEFVFLIGIN